LLESRHSTREDYEMGLETEFDSDSHYESRAVPRGDLDAEWLSFEHSLKTESRYFSHTVMQTLDKISTTLRSIVPIGELRSLLTLTQRHD